MSIVTPTRRRFLSVAVALAAGVLAVAGCRVHLHPSPTARDRVENTAVARGSALYAAYCGGCHGADGRGDGPVAYTLHLAPTDLRDPRLFADASDAEIVARVAHGEPLRTAPRGSPFATERQVLALEEYVRGLDGQRWEQLRAGRVTYENMCAACHGAYGTGEGVLSAFMRSPGDLRKESARFTDVALAGVLRNGAGGMPPMGDILAPAEVRQVIAYVRLLSPGHRVYDTYCASCHGDDGRGVHPEDALPPAIAAPPLNAARFAGLPAPARRAQVRHMFERERGLMPHFRDTLTDEQLLEIVAYLRTP